MRVYAGTPATEHKSEDQREGLCAQHASKTQH